MNIVDYFLTFSAILNFCNSDTQCMLWFGKLKFFNFKQGRMIPYGVLLVKQVALLGMSALVFALVFALAELHNEPG